MSPDFLFIPLELFLLSEKTAGSGAFIAEHCNALGNNGLQSLPVGQAFPAKSQGTTAHIYCGRAAGSIINRRSFNLLRSGIVLKSLFHH